MKRAIPGIKINLYYKSDTEFLIFDFKGLKFIGNRFGMKTTKMKNILN